MVVVTPKWVQDKISIGYNVMRFGHRFAIVHGRQPVVCANTEAGTVKGAWEALERQLRVPE